MGEQEMKGYFEKKKSGGVLAASFFSPQNRWVSEV